MIKKKGIPKPPERVQNIEVLERIQFLAQASEIAGLDEDLLDLAQYLGSEANQTAQKSKIRAKPKYRFCKQCKCPLVPPHLATITIKREHILVRCNQCLATQKIFKHRREDHRDVRHWRYVQKVHGKELRTVERPRQE